MGFTLLPQFNDPERESRHHRIRDHIKTTGGNNSLDGYTGELIANGTYYSSELLDHYKFTGVKDDVRHAMKVEVGGLPWGGQTSRKAVDGKPVWDPRQLFLDVDYDVNYTQSMKMAQSNLTRAERWSYECVQRYGRRAFYLTDANDDDAEAEAEGASA